MQSNGTIRIAIQKSGRLSEGSVALLQSMGLSFETYQNRLFAPCRNLPIDVLFIRDDDIPEYVADGVADLGIVGSNVLDERGAKVRRLLPLDFGFCSLSIAVPEQKEWRGIAELTGKRIATSYPATLRRFLTERGVRAEVIMLKGCVEIAPALRVADAICDLVSSGSTLRMNRLRVIETVAKSQAILIGSTTTTPVKTAMLEKLLLRAEGVQEARKYKCIMFNVPKESLISIGDLVPGSRSPMVIPLSDPAFAAVQIVVSEERFWDVAERIRSLGGRDIIVSPIEKFIR
ncbi:MAG: ATP phosphoribosyltransferase [Candidatus Peribacteraceae bacterium]|nr:ATP phosphoribosyltransferase [Candidatus Peribacteraceae bacterium]MDD5074957.1 ATP phosphoribosyltransferase [Candidatus Peribacteraceae bacterium]